MAGRPRRLSLPSIHTFQSSFRASRSDSGCPERSTPDSWSSLRWQSSWRQASAKLRAENWRAIKGGVVVPIGGIDEDMEVMDHPTKPELAHRVREHALRRLAQCKIRWIPADA